jgi:serine protease Do
MYNVSFQNPVKNSNEFIRQTYPIRSTLRRNILKLKSYLENFFAIIIMILILPGICFSSYPGTENEVVQAVIRVEPSVVNIKTLRPSRTAGRVSEGTGSGIIIATNGWIVTNAHVTRNAEKIFVSLNDGRTLQVQEWRANANEDIAVLKIQADNLPVAPIGDSDSLRKGQLAVAIGNPWKFASSVTVGCISAMGRNFQLGSISLKNMIQTDAAINPGNSGGALINSRGEVIGINTLVYSSSTGNHVQGLGFAIPINHAMNVARNLINTNREGSTKPWMGMMVQNVTSEMGLPVKSGALITGFPPDSPTESAGLMVGDIIVSVNEIQITSTETLQAILFRHQPGQEITMIIRRGEKLYRCRIRLEGMRQ